jgi:hypothetical protein
MQMQVRSISTAKVLSRSSAVARDCVHCGGYGFNEVDSLAAPIGWAVFKGSWALVALVLKEVSEL